MAQVIISCLYRVDPSQLEAEPLAPSPMAVCELSRQAAELVAAFRVGDRRTFDFSGLQHRLLDLLLDGRLSPASAALVLHQVLAPVPILDRATLALFLTNSIRAERLPHLAHGALLTLRRAISLEDGDVSSHALKRLDAALTTRASALFWSGPTLVVGDRVAPQTVDAAISNLSSDSAKHILVLVPDDEQATSREILLEHLRLQVRCIEDSQAHSVSPFLTAGAVQLRHTARAHASSSAFASIGRLLRTLARTLVGSGSVSGLRFGEVFSGR